MLPNNPKDPTGQNAREAKAAAALRARVARCVKVYRALLERIEFVAVSNAKSYEFRTLPSILTAWLQDAETQVDAIMLQGGAGELWFMTQFVGPAYESGAARNRAALASQSVVYKAARPDLQSLLLSEPYQRRLSLLAAREFEAMKGLGNEIKKDMAQILTAGMASGQGPIVITKQMTEQLGIEKRRAERIARTEINNAHTEARMDQAVDARRLGIESMEMHVSALGVQARPTHRARHGTLHTVQEQRDWWSRDGNRINCYLPGTRVRGEFMAGSKGHYRGPAVHIVTASGRNLRVTFNHPVMTPFGLVAAGKLRKGDNLLAHVGHVEDSLGVAALNVEDGNADIEQVFTTIMQLNHPVTLGVTTVDFHGDGAAFDEDIQVVRADRLLAVGCNAETRQMLDQLKLKHSNPVETTTIGPRHLGIDTIDLTSPSSLSSSSESLPVFRGGLTHSQVSSVGAPSDFDALSFEDSPDYRARNVELSSYCQLGESIGVQLDNVVSVEVFEWCGHVYDLEEVSGLMVAGGLIASNCRCSTVTVLVDSKGNPLTPQIVEAARRQKKE